ncbi:MAG: (E)-4-hydroxy-3-methylbut-2-enyl-diphosphate synthase [Bacteroidia bacterium]|nr:(E)-4-hydroxy-3-methylbut-2-enyl-diphosphate synthase [Bacteroidia bacterium]MCX7652294.1 (E)-4-hydroxy-3-methylbut-2-enyl-diphosphate synthase [Bacteroidia bacterium]MDW8416556.1 (E)-4-hydroxy-3-methylbut-2-enyl-diphosphate synthase [Bacteroidia bacterium]
MSVPHFSEKQAYYTSLVAPKRLPTIEVPIGEIPVGGSHPIRIQTMTTTDTLDIEGTVSQVIRLAEAGAEYVRITAPSQKEAEALAEIKKRIRQQGYKVPLVADIHFTPRAAEIAARIVEKVRINPGNYADKKRFEQRTYTDAEYEAELVRIYEKFAPLVRICKEYGTAMRIGVNHGSLSDRILNRYGDTPEGMVESAMEFVRICEAEGFYQIVISMKASNPAVMVSAYRQLVARLRAHGRLYPIHLGVTEAGDGSDGRIKSALGIESLLLDGIGDTVRVSLTEPPENELPTCKALVSFAEAYRDAELSLPEPVWIGGGLRHERFSRRSVAQIGELNPAIVVADHSRQVQGIDLYGGEQTPDFIYVGEQVPERLPSIRLIYDYPIWQKVARPQDVPYFPSVDSWLQARFVHPELNFVKLSPDDLLRGRGDFLASERVVWVLEGESPLPGRLIRWMRLYSANQRQFPPMIARLTIYPPENSPEPRPAHALAVEAAAQVSPFLVDGMVDGLWLYVETRPPAVGVRLAFDLLQSARLRIIRTDYIACPSCGRTLFSLEEVTARIRARTSHLKGLKIAIMGCIVNGPGEMADADYGYVGAGPGTIHLYRGKDIVRKNVREEEALEALVELIRSDGRWVDPPDTPLPAAEPHS